MKIIIKILINLDFNWNNLAETQKKLKLKNLMSHKNIKK